MKLLVFVLCAGLAACSSPSQSPNPTSSVAPSSTLAPSTTVSASCPQPAVGMVKCYDWGPCKGLFESIAAAVDMFKNDSSCMAVDGVAVKGGFGPCALCQSFKAPSSVKAMAVQPKWEDVKSSIGVDHSKLIKVGDKVE
jgi:hypothetical protein